MRFSAKIAVALAIWLGLFARSSFGQGQPETTAFPKDVEQRFVETSETTFSLTGAAAVFVGKAAPVALAVINHFGTANQIGEGLKSQEALVKEMLETSHLPGVLIYVEQQTSNSDVQITTLVGGKPIVIGPGLNQISTLEAYRASNKDSFEAQVSAGYRRNDDASFFLWAKNVSGNVEYGLTVPATPLLNEARRTLSDFELTKQFLEQYDNQLRTNILSDIERRAASQAARQQAQKLLDQRQKALQERQKINQELKDALDRAAKAQKSAAVFQTLAQVLTVAKLGASLAAEFPDKASAINSANSTSDLQKIFTELVNEANTNEQAISGRVSEFEDRQRNLRLEELTVIRAQKVNPDEIPGVLP